MKKLLLTMLLGCLFATGALAKGIQTSYRNVLVYAYSQANSVYEDENIKLEIYNQNLYATNLTKKTIFLDLSQCFMVHNGSSFPMKSAQDQDERHASKKGYSTSMGEFLSIAPATGNKQNATFICHMADGIFGEYTTTTTPSGKFTEYDKRLFSVIAELTSESQKASKNGKEYLGTVSRHLTEDESINNIGASIAYAFSKNSEDWNSVTLSTWVSDVILAPCYSVIPEGIKKKDKKGFAAKETAPVEYHVRADSPFEFDQDKSPIIISDWSGNYKKGKFRLGDVTIYEKAKGGVLLAILSWGASLMLPREAYKSAIKFDGAKADWGKMTLTNRMSNTFQKN